MKTFEGTVVFTSAGADTNARAIAGRIEAFLPTRPRTWLLGTLGSEGYFSMMKLASVMIGNSSSGIIEAPSFELPVVNIGDRQAGRLRAANVVDVDGDRTSIVGGIRR
ncbi:MAG: UDP-N-acetylglucosamine 2-epimerase (hydrolyzing), partial [Actinobacteria bacterium]